MSTEQRRKQVIAALVERGYRRLNRRQLAKRHRPDGLVELVSPSWERGQPILPECHSVLVGDDSLSLLYDGATLPYAVPLPERTIKLLLRGVL